MSSACAIPLSAIPLPARNPPLSFFSLLSTLSPASSLWLTSLTAGLAVDPSLSGFTLLSRPFQTQAHRSLSPPSQALSRSVTIASSSSCVGRQRFLRRELVLGRCSLLWHSSCSQKRMLTLLLLRIKAAPHTPLRLRDDPETGSILEKLTEENLRDWGLLQDFYRFVKTIESSAKEFFGQRWNSCNSRNS
nr:uncharacterized protein LOC112764707 isoform X1 [Arachis hypogaea]XP_025666229.1 uncharacterized protein LOC112764707 isoform X1 [Arachis hypogaea]XP_025666230.1 uncharacterized protein LOC112764707 isoform X1 [Arachis hypogaea]XP_025666231.1 uncharacterized protein LOC112764707 isoform X1 [Arachis hypogaea]XP_025666232.1 uncharacterized protein LOC112764707 isoform X1 [Arachis hypogaea]